MLHQLLYFVINPRVPFVSFPSVLYGISHTYICHSCQQLGCIIFWKFVFILCQDLAQPKLEASPPDGVLTVPLLRHQVISFNFHVLAFALPL